ncbi:DNA endonuclease RBBP8 [Leuresthes tenuis]|uniref:DNA endonuclease RBBP8 n=1 Tax=Leuresthes tenuis TaxID=355514 RepID=UPI003B504C63
MSSPGDSSGSTKPADPFEDLWRQLGECHQNALKDLEAKVSKLKKDRCLDAQRLEVFYNRNQQLKEQNKTLQDTINLLEERLRAGECDRCAILEENLKTNRDQNLQLVAKLKNERSSLEDENKKLQAELQTLKASPAEPKDASSPESEEGVIPDSPLLASSLPVANKLRKRKRPDKVRHVRYAEMPLPSSNSSLFYELHKDPPEATKNPRRVDMLVPNTCELDASQISKDEKDDGEEAVAETCALELLEHHRMKIESAPNQKSDSRSPWKHDVRLKPYCSSSSSALKHSPDSTTERSPSLLPRYQRFVEGSSICKVKWTKGESNPEGVEAQREDKRNQAEVVSHTTNKVQSEQSGTSSQKPNVCCISPAFKKPQNKLKGGRTSLQDLNASHGQPEAKQAEEKHAVEPMWSIDPALALPMCDSEPREDEEMEEQQRCGELTDTDRTWVSHSMLQRPRGNSQGRRDTKSGLGGKANDSLDMMFETTAYGEYKSFNSSHFGSQPCEDDDEDENEEGEKKEDDSEQDSQETAARQSKAGWPTFAHVAVVRKKDERRKLKGTTCKECEVYYAHLPEEEKQKKLSACSRHRFRYIPPSTPENFWEVGFPSTQTCIERGYIKEEKNPQARLRRRQPLNAFFSPKPKQQHTEDASP